MTVHSFLHSMRRMGALFVCLHAGIRLMGQDAVDVKDGILPETDPPIVRSLHELDVLGNERISNGVTAEIIAHVSYHDPVLDVLFVQDNSAGIFGAVLNPELPYLAVGTLVSVKGTVEPGKFKPYLANAEVVSLRENRSAPEAHEYGLQILETGRHDGQMVRVQGRVRSVEKSGNSLSLNLLNEGGKYTAFVRDIPDEKDAESLIDSVVEVSGACGFDFGGEKLLSVRLYADKFHQLKLLEPSRTSFSQSPVERINAEIQGESVQFPEERILLHGNYLGEANDGRIYFQTTREGALVELAHSIEDLELERGDPIAVLGWGGLVNGDPIIGMEQARIEKLEPGLVPTLAEQATDKLTASNLNRWLSLEGTLEDVETVNELLVFHLETQGKHLAVMLSKSPSLAEALILPEEGSLLAVNGILTGLPSEQGLGEFPTVRVFSLADIKVLSPPNWWTVERIAWVLAGAGLIGLSAVAWSVLLNRRVKQQTSALRQTLEQERLMEERYRKIFESALDMILLADHRANILSINPAGAELLRDDPASFEGKSFMNWVFLEDRGKAEQAFGLGSKTGHELTLDGEVVELRLIAKGGESIYVELSVRGVLLSEGNYGYQCIARNIDARKQSEAHLIKARNASREANRAKSSFLAMMSHELRTPMNGVMGMTQMLQQTKLDAHQQEIAKTIQVSSKAMMKLILDLLDISRIESDQFKLSDEPFELVQVVEDALATLYPESMRKKLNLTLYCQPRIPNQLRGDATRIRQILLNLIGNGIKFTEKGGVAVRISGEPQSKMVHQIRFEVMDTGIGLGGLRQQDLFEAFVQLDSSNTRKFGGAGLGLSICKRIVQAMGGVIGVEGQSKQGAVFWFEIPFKLAHANSSIRPPQMSASTAGKEVNVLSENSLVRDYFRMRCKDVGLSTHFFKPQDFLSEIRAESSQVPQKHSIVVLDMEFVSEECLKELKETVDSPGGDATRWVLLSSMEEERELASKNIGNPQSLILLKPLAESTFRSFCDFISDHESSDLGNGGADGLVDSDPSSHCEPESACQGLRVLVAEDDLINQKLIQLYLKKAGCEYEIVPDGKQVISLLEKQSFDVVLMDCSMPVMDGFEATRQIRSNSNYDDIKVIALAAHSLKGDRERCLKAGMDDYMAKPLNLDKLTEKLSSINTVPSANGH